MFRNSTTGDRPLGRASCLMRNSLGLAIAAVVACGANEANASTIEMGDAGTFAVLGGSTVTNTGPSTIFGDVGVAPGTSITGFPPGEVFYGTTHSNTSFANSAQADALTAYNQLADLTPTTDLTGQDLGGMTLTPGVYSFSSSASLTGTLTLDGLGQTNPQFIFQMGSTLTTASDASVNLTNGDFNTACNVYWQVGSSATLGTNTDFTGTIIADQSATLNTGASLMGRVIALNGAVTLDDNHIVNVKAIPLPAPAWMGLAGLAGVVVLRRRRQSSEVN